MSNAKQILFFEKNAADYSFPNVVMTASEASSYAPYVQKRSNFLGWMTTGSVDANNTTLTCNFVDLVTLTDIILVKHNFKSFTIQYYDGHSMVDFSTPINQTTNTDSTTRFSFNSIQTTMIVVTITGTQIANSDKKLSQLIATSLLGQLNGWPVIKKPTFNLNKRVNTMLSGKTDVGVNAGGFTCDLTVSVWRDNGDLTLLETLYNVGEGFLVWLCGGNQNQFSSIRQGYRLEDFFLVKCQDNYTPEWVSGLYTSGLNIAMTLVEIGA